jgi:ABC-type Mn2+/Zn2+ transport system permease subunit
MNSSLLLQILGSISVLIGYYLNSNNNPRQHMAFILGHIFLLGFTAIESKWVLFLLSVAIIILQYRISQKKWKFKKDLVRVKKVVIKTQELTKGKYLSKNKL